MFHVICAGYYASMSWPSDLPSPHVLWTKYAFHASHWETRESAESFMTAFNWFRDGPDWEIRQGLAYQSKVA